MRFLLDHDVPDEVGRVLAQAGHNVLLLRSALNREATDRRVIEYATADKRVLVTCNRDDFIHLARSHAHAGLVIVIRRRSRIAECGCIIRLLNMAGDAGIAGNINFA